MDIDQANSKQSVSIELKWDQIYEKVDTCCPADVLVENSFLLPENGCALDLASGLGANALFLAERGLQVHAWDISSVALKKLKLKSRGKNLGITVKQVFLDAEIIPKNIFDVIVITRFLDRSLSNAIIESLKTGGLLYYQTFVQDKIDDSGPKNPDYLLTRNELLNLFSPLYIVAYRENARIGDLECGERNEALFVGQKR